MGKYVAHPRLPEHARYGKAKDMVEKKVASMPTKIEFVDCHGRSRSWIYKGHLAETNTSDEDPPRLT